MCWYSVPGHWTIFMAAKFLWQTKVGIQLRCRPEAAKGVVPFSMQLLLLQYTLFLHLRSSSPMSPWAYMSTSITVPGRSQVAQVKVCCAASRQEHLDQFSKELRIHKRVSGHPNVVSFLKAWCHVATPERPFTGLLERLSSKVCFPCLYRAFVYVFCRACQMLPAI